MLLVRHAPADPRWEPERRLCGWFDPPLGRDGLALAGRIAPGLAATGACAVYSSPLRRAWETAEPIARALGVQVRADERLREIGCGRMDGMLIEEVRAQFPELWRRNLEQRDDQFRWPGGESYAEFRARVAGALAAIAASHHGETIVLVAHTGVVTQTIGMLHGWNAARWDRRRPRHAAVTTVQWDGDGPLEVIEAPRD
jgi:broad specificity phosphatase PhoE